MAASNHTAYVGVLCISSRYVEYIKYPVVLEDDIAFPFTSRLFMEQVVLFV